MLTPIPPGSLISPRTMASTLEDMLRRDIITGALLPGSRLGVKELGERYEAGAIPLREALSRLCATGLVLAVDQKGFRVADVSLEELADITETRQEIERLAIVRAIRRRDPTWEGELLSAHHQLQRLSVYEPQDSDRLNPGWERAHRQCHTNAAVKQFTVTTSVWRSLARWACCYRKTSGPRRFVAEPIASPTRANLC